MQSNFVVWTDDIVDGACTLSPMMGYPDDWKLLKGVKVADEFPNTSRFNMNPDNKTNIMLTDSLHNQDRLIVASQRLQDMLVSLNVGPTEYLPVPIIDHKSRAVVSPYCIAHPLDPVDCLVLDACDIRWGRVDKTEIARLQRLVIDESRIAPGRLLFRPQHYKRAILAHRTVAASLDTAGCTGIRWVELADYH